MDIDAALVDMNGLFRHWRNIGAAQGEQAANLPAGTIHTYAYEHPNYKLARIGVLTDQQWAKDVEERLVADFGPRALAAIPAWRADRGDADRGMIRILDSLRRIMPVAVLSNCTDALRADLALHGIVFDHVFPSAEIGTEKPSRLAYTTAADIMGVRPDRLGFWDDQQYFVDAAAHVGLKAHLFRTPAGMVADLVGHGIPVTALAALAA